MRWDAQRTDADAERRLPGLDTERVRTFDAPEALDTRFHEVRAKSALNKVPGSYLPFNWTVNAFRGCAHACSYCMGASTPVLMADGTSKPIADVRVGDEVYGTERRGAYRRYVRTQVLAHWPSRREAYRVALEDGTELIASADHRFLSGRGRWKHVTGAEQGAARRPHLTLNDELMGFGSTGQNRVEGVAVKSNAKLDVVSIEPLGKRVRMFDITTGTGDFVANGVISHNCFARNTHTYLDLNAGRDFEREIIVKVNVPELLRAELNRPSWKREVVAFGTNTDPYQWAEGRYRLMPPMLEALREARTPASILTKSSLAMRDLDLFKELAEVAEVSVNFSVPTLDEKAWRATEPHTPHPRKRLDAVAALNEAGIPSGVLVAPLMPGINDSPEQVEEIVSIAEEAGATFVNGIALHLRPGVKEVFMEWLGQAHPELVERYTGLYAGRAYAPKAEQGRISRLIRPTKTTAGDPRFSRRERFARQRAERREHEEARRTAQTSLF